MFVAVKAQASAIASAEEGIANWEAQSILMLWLSMLILVPFDLATIDSTATDMAGARSGTPSLPPSIPPSVPPARPYFEIVPSQMRVSLPYFPHFHCAQLHCAGLSRTRSWFPSCSSSARTACTSQVTSRLPPLGRICLWILALSASHSSPESITKWPRNQTTRPSSHPGSVREMGALFLGRMLTRPDMGAALGDFITWAEQALATVSDLAAPFLLPGGCCLRCRPCCCLSALYISSFSYIRPYWLISSLKVDV